MNLEPVRVVFMRFHGRALNAFSRYERGEVMPLPAVVNLFRLLDKHPELLQEIA